MRLILLDLSAALVAAWSEAFADEEDVEVHCSDLFAHPADAMVSPANSFGIMDGGLDRAIRDTASARRDPQDPSRAADELTV